MPTTTTNEPQVVLPRSGGTLRVALGPPADLPTSSAPATSREVYAAAHVVADGPQRADGTPRIDWEATAAQRHRLWALGLGVAESMDTAQRGMGLDWPLARELAHRTLAEADLELVHDIEDAGGRVVLMASRHLAATANDRSDYLRVYSRVLAEVRHPVVLHWLGPAFDPALAGYWGDPDPARAMDTVVDLVAGHAEAVDGIKVSLLDADLERELRRRVPDSVRVYTGDDYHYTDLIAGDEEGHSHALLGAFSFLAPVAAKALSRLDAGDPEGFRALLSPTEALSRLVFQGPTRFYKVGVAWLAHLCGYQEQFHMVAGLEGSRSPEHLGELLVAADRLGLFPDPDLTAARARAWFSAQGVC
jgi:hypothetical protein